MEDGHLCRPSWTTSTSNDPNTVCLQTVEVGTSTEPSTEALGFVTEDGNLCTPSWINNPGKYQTTMCPHAVEDETPDHSLPGPHISAVENNCKPLLTIVDSSVPTAECPQLFEDVASKKTTPGILTSVLKKKDGHRAISVNNNHIMNFKHEILQDQSSVLQVTMSKLPTEDIKPLRCTSTNKKKGHVIMSPQRSSQTPGCLASEVNPFVEGPDFPRAKSAIDEIKVHRAAWAINNIQNTFSNPSVEGKAIGKPTAWECLAAEEIKPCKGKASAKVNKTVKFDLSPPEAEITKTVRFNLSTPKAVESLASRGKSTAEDTKLPCATLNTKTGHKAKNGPFMDNYVEFKAKFNSTANQGKQFRTNLAPLTWRTQIMEGQSVKLLNNPLTKKTRSSQRREGKVVGTTTTKANLFTDNATLGRFSSKIIKGIQFDWSPKRAEDPASKHLNAEDNLETKELKWCRGTFTTNSPCKISNPRKAEGGSTGPQTAKGMLAVEDLNQGRATLFSKSMQENESPSLAEPTTVKIQAAGINSTEEDTKMDKVASNTKITNESVSPLTVTDQSCGILPFRANPSPEIKLHRQSMILSNVYFTLRALGPATGLLATRGNLKTRKAKPYKDASSMKIVHQTLHFRSVRLLPARANPAECKKQRAEGVRNATVCDLEIRGANLGCIHSQLIKPHKFIQFERSECECSTPHTSPCALMVTSEEEQTCPGEHVDSQHILHEYRRSRPQSPNTSDKNTCSKLTDNLEKTVEAPKMIGIQEEEMHIGQELLQQNRKQIHEEILFVKDPNTFSLKHSVTSNEPPEAVFQDHREIEQWRKESPSRYMKPTTDLTDQHLQVCKRPQLEVTSQLPRTTHTFQLKEVMDTNVQASQDENTHNDSTAKEGNAQNQLLPQREFLLKKVSEADKLQLRDDQIRRHKKKIQLGTIRKISYNGFGINIGKENNKRRHKSYFFYPEAE